MVAPSERHVRCHHNTADRSVNPTTLNPVLVKEDPRSEAGEMAEALTTASDIAVE
ncbi:hypothetical protein [Bradyrhizobium elkanii]|uniref:hypothetical protein n=1 Tax=Bradyrhizobium elkanii TaxID=29448 RepID=UPI0035136EAD